MSKDFVSPDGLTSLGLGSGVKRGGKEAPREGKTGSTMGGESKGVVTGDPITKYFHDRPSSKEGLEISLVQFDGDGLCK